MERLPPDLERIGEHLVAGAERAVAARRRRTLLLTRAGATGIAALLAGATLLPGALGPAERPAGGLTLVGVPSAAVPVACDGPRGRHAAPPACSAGEPIRIGRPRRW
jgi:hypothetical protein